MFHQDRRNWERKVEIELDFDADIPWENGLDITRNLLPVDEDSPFINQLPENEKLALSWALGLLAASAIKEHEKILNDLRHIAYPENRIEGLQFFMEEAVHASAFDRYLDMAAGTLNLTKKELSSFLPSFHKSSIPALLYALEGMAGGHAIWWTVAATEEESIRLYQKISPHEGNTDQVFFQLNRLHFLEESRHSSFSYKMIGREKKGFGKFLSRYSFASSRILQTWWLFKELASFKKVKAFRNRHPLLESMSVVSEKIDQLSFREKTILILKDVSYTRMMTRPESHPRLKRALEKENLLILRLPDMSGERL